MTDQNQIVSPGPDACSVRNARGEILRVPSDWMLLPPGDPGLTRRVKAAGPSWTVQEKQGRRVFSRGVWAPRSTIETIRAQLEQERSSPAYTKNREAAARRRERQQGDYVASFHRAVLDFLAFHTRYADLAEQVAHLVTEHATPVGSGTVARTSRIPLENRAEAAVIAWMRHQTTGYDNMVIPRIKGQRREVRRLLAERSRLLLENYRTGEATNATTCPLQKALAKPNF